LVYVLAGHGSVGGERIAVQTGQLAVHGPGNMLRIGAAARQESRSPNLDVLVLGGRPIREPIAWAGPFVMNTRDEVMQAFTDYQAGRLGSIPAVHGPRQRSRRPREVPTPAEGLAIHGMRTAHQWSTIDFLRRGRSTETPPALPLRHGARRARVGTASWTPPEGPDRSIRP
jgi:hypothetical protein